MSDKFKKLTGKNPKDFEPIAFEVINDPAVDVFAELVQNDDFLFDFVKQNVVSRLEKNCNQSNYLNLLQFLKYYSPTYEEFIISNLVRYADENLTDKMLELFEKGSDDEKTYCAKFFSYVKDTLALEFLKQNAFSENGALSSNCASALATLGDEEVYNKALEMLDSDDDFVRLDGVKFLVAYGRVDAVKKILVTMTKSSMAENIAGEIPYLCDLFTLYKKDVRGALFVVNSIINGLGEILGLAQVFDFQLYEFLQMLISEPKTSAIGVVLINAQDKFETLTENDEYLFDETKDTKQEVLEIKKLLQSVDFATLYGLIDDELVEDSLFIYSALEFTDNEDSVRNLLTSSNPTVIMKSLEVLKIMDSLTQDDKDLALKSISDDNLRNVVMAL